MFLKLADMELEHYKLIKRELEKYTSDPKTSKLVTMSSREMKPPFSTKEKSRNL